MLKVNDILSIARIRRLTKHGWKFYLDFLDTRGKYRHYRVVDINFRKRRAWIRPNRIEWR